MDYKASPKSSAYGLRDTTMNWIKAIQGEENPLKKLTDDMKAGKSKEIDYAAAAEENKRVLIYITIFFICAACDLVCCCLYFSCWFSENVFKCSKCC